MSFIALLLYFFCTIIRPQDWVSSMLEWRLINILAYTTLGLLILERMSSKTIKFANVPQNWLMLGFYIAICMSHIAHTYLEGLTTSFQLFLPNFILFFLVLNGLNTETKFKITIWFIVFMVLILVPQGVYQLQHGYGWGGQEITFDPERQEKRINWIGIFNDPNDLGLLFVVVSGIVMAFAFGKSNFFVRIASFAFIANLFYGIFLTNSRGSLLALMTTVYFFFVRITRRFMVGGIIGGIVAAIILGLGPSRTGIITTTEESAYNRIELWWEGVQMFKANPLFGVGHNMFMDELPQTAHNSFVLAFSELGFFGYFLWVGLIYASYKCLSFVQTNDPRLKTYAIGVQSALIGFCAAAFFLSRTYNILPYILFALSGSLANIVLHKNPELKLEFDKKDLKNIFWICVGIFILILILVKVGI